MPEMVPFKWASNLGPQLSENFVPKLRAALTAAKRQEMSQGPKKHSSAIKTKMALKEVKGQLRIQPKQVNQEPDRCRV